MSHRLCSSLSEKIYLKHFNIEVSSSIFQNLCNLNLNICISKKTVNSLLSIFTSRAASHLLNGFYTV